MQQKKNLNKCPLCSYEKTREIFTLKKVPISYLSPLEKSHIGKEILVDLKIVKCEDCSHIYNSDFRPFHIDSLYKNNYSSGIANSKAVFEKYYDIAENIIEEKNIKDKIVVEIGSSNFSFSKILLEKNANHIFAYEPSFSFINNDDKITFINDFFNFKNISFDYKKVDLVVMRHVLEHCPSPSEIIKDISSMGKEGMKIYIEVPNVLDIFEDGRFYDFFYEHIHYFNPNLLPNYLKKFGLRLLKINYLANNQHFGLFLEKSDLISNENILDIKKSDVNLDNEIIKFKKNMDLFEKNLKNLLNNYEKVAIYGGGSHGLGIAAIFNLDPNKIQYFLDLDKFKSNKFAPKTHIPIFSPLKVNLNLLQAIIIIAPLYQDEIINDLKTKFEFKGDIWSTYPNICLVD